MENHPFDIFAFFTSIIKPFASQKWIPKGMYGHKKTNEYRGAWTTLERKKYASRDLQYVAGIGNNKALLYYDREKEGRNTIELI